MCVDSGQTRTSTAASHCLRPSRSGSSREHGAPSKLGTLESESQPLLHLLNLQYRQGMKVMPSEMTILDTDNCEVLGLLAWLCLCLRVLVAGAPDMVVDGDFVVGGVCE